MKAYITRLWGVGIKLLDVPSVYVFGFVVQSKSGFFVPLYFFVVKSHVKIVVFVIQLENNRFICLRVFFLYRVTLSFWQCNQMDNITRFRLCSQKFRDCLVGVFCYKFAIGDDWCNKLP